jgi:ABC-type lipoprotein export system ATPase subunit
MSYSNWQKGSQWRKWDLHVHTPASFHWKGSKILREMSIEEKDLSFQELLTTLEDSDVAVFCFMDYWTFDGYLQFKDFLRRKNLSCTKTFFPGMELRVEAPVDYRLNIHVILSDMLSNQQLDDFKSRLKVGSINRPISDEAIVEFAKSLDPSKSKVHGYDNPKNLSQNELLQLGASTIVITKESLMDAIKSVPTGMAFIIMPFDTSDGLLDLDWKTHPHADNYFMQTAHIFESRKDETIELFLGIKTDKNQGIIENFQKTLKNVNKPVICGSDAHRYSDYGNFPGNKATWIKADPTFNGFKQIIYEPRERVVLQELQPHEKIPYRVIDKVRFIDKADRKLFSSDWIDFNGNLNAIIGGKSSGKSLLLYHIAKTIAPTLIENRSTEVNILDYNFGSLEQFDFEVLWKDGYSDRLSTASEKPREIEYIPQLYVNALAEKQGKASLYKLIESILEQNIEYREFIQEVKQEISDLEIDLDSTVTELLQKREDLQTLINERKAIGDSKAINEEISRLTGEISKLREASNFTAIEEENYKKLIFLQSEERKRKRKFEEVGYAIDSSTTTLEQIKKQALQTLENPKVSIGLETFSRRVLSILKSTASHTLTTTFDLLKTSQNTLAQKARTKSEKCAENERRILEDLRPYTSKISDQTRLKSFEANLKEQQLILEAYNQKTLKIDAVIEVGVQTRAKLFQKYANLFSCYERIIDKLIKDEYSKIDNDIVLDAFLRFDNERFSASFGDIFDRRSNSFKAIFGLSFNDNNEFQFEESEHIQNIANILDKLSSKAASEIIFRKGMTQNDAISKLFNNYFKVEYNIRYKNDQILDMSPGKRGLVLLQLILHISNATHPILIDQPEDNLDNRTISNELRQFITAKKQTRQIIMVTHDANLVVLTDAENIIVSNQDGQQANRENAEYRFEYVAGALENSFRRDENEVSKGILQSCGIREHVCDVLEGGEAAFKKREEKYGFSNR